MAEVIVWKCVVCGKSWDNVQSLRAHMKVHKGVVFRDLHVRLPVGRVEWFLAFCRKHNTTTCNMVLAMLDAYEAGEKAGVTVIGGANPVIAQVNTIVASRPRGHGKYDVAGLGTYIPNGPQVYCAFCGGFSGSLVFCQRYGSNWLPSARCVECPSNWFKK